MVARAETQFDRGVMVMRGPFSSGHCTPRSGSAYLLRAQSNAGSHEPTGGCKLCVCACGSEVQL